MLQGLHGRFLRLVCERAGVHFEGLAAASRWLARQGCKDKKALKKVAQVDVVAAWLRHAMVPLGDTSVARVALQLDQCGVAAAASSGGRPQVRDMLR